MLYKNEGNGEKRPEESAARIMRAALGEICADFVLKNGLVLNVFTNELQKADVAVCDDMIVGVGGGYDGIREIDVDGRYLAPGFIDAHVHIESSMLTPRGFAAAVLPRGTTTAIADPHEIANVCGTAGISYMISEAEKSPMNLYIMLPSCVPATDFDTGGASLGAEELEPFREWGGVLGLGEMMNVPGVLTVQPEVHEKLRHFGNSLIDGHAPLLSGRALQAYRLAGVSTDHECTTEAETLEKLRAGFAILIREGSGARNLEDLISLILSRKLRCDRFCFCTDDKHIDDILCEGHIGYNIQRAIGLGIDPIEAYKMASWYPAQIYGLDHLGALAPGYQADIIVLDDLSDGTVSSVYCKGKRAVSLEQSASEPAPACLTNTVHICALGEQSFALPLKSDRAPVVEFRPRQINTRLIWEKVGCKDGFFIPSGSYRKAAVIERHRASGNIGLGIVKGLPIHGAIASTVAHDSHNLAVIGDNDGDMLAAARELARCEGGYIVVRDGRVLSCLPLSVGGLMCCESPKKTAGELERMKFIFREMNLPEGCDPFHMLSFLSLPVLPEARITDRGVFDSVRMEYLSF